jgi:hypothetical protein
MRKFIAEQAGMLNVPLYVFRLFAPTTLLFAALGSLNEACLAGGSANPQTNNALLPIRVQKDGHYLETADGRPFFWLGDTAWQLIDGTTREQCSYYLHARAAQGFTVVQTAVLAEFDGLNQPSVLGERPFFDNDPMRPNDRYFERVVEIVDQAASVGLYVALLPTWGDKLTAPWGAGPRVFRKDNLPVARAYANYLGLKLRGRSNVVWMLGGDRPAQLDGSKPDQWPHPVASAAGFSVDYDWTPIWREIAAGLADGTGATPVCLYHPQGGDQTTSVMMPNESWLSINGMQSGHGGGHDLPVWNWIARDFALVPAKPTLDLEPNYEDHPYNPWPAWDPATGYFRDYDVRKQTYRSVFAGACGVTYGHHAVWQFAGSRKEVINHADRDWTDALYRPGARQMRFLRQLIESRPFFSRIPDQSLIVGDAGNGGLHLQAARDREGTYAFVYFPINDQSATIALAKLNARHVRVWWYDPRTGVGKLMGEFAGGRQREFRSPPEGPDWVLVLDDADKKYAPPGLEAIGY